MVSVKIDQLKPGDKLFEDVHTPLGSLLLLKEKLITERDIQLLSAFMVEKVVIEKNLEYKDLLHNNVEEISTEEQPKSNFQHEYNKMVELLKQLYQLVQMNRPIPLMDIRNQLGNIFQYIAGYNIITFSPHIKNNEDYMYHKSVTTSITSYLLAQWVGMPKKDWMQIALAGLLMDIGNVKVDPSILNKPGKLTLKEMQEMQKHTIYGYQILRPITALNEGVKLAALQHHERVDKSGYPNEFEGSQLHSYSKLVAIADIYHAMTLNKVYRDPVSPYLVLEQIQSESFGRLEPIYVRIFIEKVSKFDTGTKVKLSDNRVGEIVFYERDYPTRPWVSINGTIVNLTKEPSIYIVEII